MAIFAKIAPQNYSKKVKKLFAWAVKVSKTQMLNSNLALYLTIVGPDGGVPKLYDIFFGNTATKEHLSEVQNL